MTENMWLAVIICGCVFACGVLASLFAGNGETAFDKLIAARKEVRLAELKLRQIEAEHLRKCPRLTDSERA